jgi:hypothetical protein
MSADTTGRQSKWAQRKRRELMFILGVPTGSSDSGFRRVGSHRCSLEKMPPNTQDPLAARTPPPDDFEVNTSVHQ